MSVVARYENGVFKPLEDVKEASAGKLYRVFAEEELRGLKDQLAWLKAAEPSFAFCDNDEDAVYDTL